MSAAASFVRWCRETRLRDLPLVGLSIGVQRLVRSDPGAAGVMFTIDPDSDFRGVAPVDAAHGFGEAAAEMADIRKAGAWPAA